MPIQSRGQRQVNTKVRGYATFVGIDRSRPREAMEAEEITPLWTCKNAFCDWRGIVEREPAFVQLKQSGEGGTRNIRAVRFFSQDDVVWAESDRSQGHLNSSRGGNYDEAFPKDTPVYLAPFLGSVYAMSPGQTVKRFDGGIWRDAETSIRPGFGTGISNRFAVAGIPGLEREVHLSRVGTATTFPENEPTETTEVTKAAFIDITNKVGPAEVITGLGVFESNRLAIFTQDQALIYKVTEDFTEWTIDERANLKVGCISASSVVNVESDLFFCSRHGVHSIMRSESNGLTIVPMTMSPSIERLYKSMVRATFDQRLISACYDQDEGNLHIYFPRPNGNSERLTMHMRGGYENLRWSQGDFLSANCGDSVGGRFVQGCPGGVYEALDRANTFASEDQPASVRGQAVIETPVLWLGDRTSPKQCRMLHLQAYGASRILVTVMDEDGNTLKTHEVYVEAPDWEVDDLPTAPLSRRFSFPMGVWLRGAQLRIETIDDDRGDFRLVAFAFEIVKEE